MCRIHDARNSAGICAEISSSSTVSKIICVNPFGCRKGLGENQKKGVSAQAKFTLDFVVGTGHR